MTAAPRMVLPRGVTLSDAEAQLRLWVRTCERIQELRREAEAEGSAPEVLWQISKYGRAAAKETMRWDETVRAMRGDL